MKPLFADSLNLCSWYWPIAGAAQTSSLNSMISLVAMTKTLYDRQGPVLSFSLTASYSRRTFTSLSGFATRIWLSVPKTCK